MFLLACNGADEPVRASTDRVVEDACGEVFEPQPADVAEPLRYAPEGTVAPGTCTPPRAPWPASASWAGRSSFTIPFKSARERPLVLDGHARERLQLDV